MGFEALMLTQVGGKRVFSFFAVELQATGERVSALRSVFWMLENKVLRTADPLVHDRLLGHGTETR
jgi:hypothetical protein